MHVVAQLIGYPRIGPNRELKWALEKAWSGRSTPAEFDARVAELRRAHLDEQVELIGSAVDDFFLYDEVLETALMLGIHPRGLPDAPFELLTALARGTAQREAWEMTKWFDTNYHYVVPEVERLPDRLVPLPWRETLPVAEVIWPILGPYSFARLSKHPGLDATDLARAAGTAIGAWVAAAAERVPPPAGRALPRDAPGRCRRGSARRRLRRAGQHQLERPAPDHGPIRRRVGRDARGARVPRFRGAGRRSTGCRHCSERPRGSRSPSTSWR